MSARGARDQRFGQPPLLTAAPRPARVRRRIDAPSGAGRARTPCRDSLVGGLHSVLEALFSPDLWCIRCQFPEADYRVRSVGPCVTSVCALGPSTRGYRVCSCGNGRSRKVSAVPRSAAPPQAKAFGRIGMAMKNASRSPTIMTLSTASQRSQSERRPCTLGW